MLFVDFISVVLNVITTGYWILVNTDVCILKFSLCMSVYVLGSFKLNNETFLIRFVTFFDTVNRTPTIMVLKLVSFEIEAKLIANNFHRP